MKATRCVLQEHYLVFDQVCQLALPATLAGCLASPLLNWLRGRNEAEQTEPRFTVALTHEEIAARKNWCGLILSLCLVLFGCSSSSSSKNSSDTKTSELAPSVSRAEAGTVGASPDKTRAEPTKFPIDPALVYVNRANILYLSGKYDEALTALSRALEFKENPSVIHALIGLVHDDRGETEQAATEFETEVALMPPQVITNK
jgi:tetratricopeptide (TPR) repeat protein